MRLGFALPFLPLLAAHPRPAWADTPLDLSVPLQWAFDGAEALVGTTDETQSIWEKLQEDDKYSKLVKILKFEEDTIKDLDNKNNGYAITFFAVNNDGIKPPHHHHRHNDSDDHAWLRFKETTDETPTLSSISTALETDPELVVSGGGDDKKKRRREILKKIAHAVLQYHILPQDHSQQQLAQNSTFATALKPHDGSSDGLARRIHVSKHLVPPSLKVNFYATVQGSTSASNGKVHELDHPLFPPASIFEEAFIISRYLSTSTSAIQRVGGRHFVDWEYDHERSKKGHPKFKGAPLATFFAPSNDAWNALPHRLHFFLFSKPGRHVLGKLLAYHYVPHTLALSEVIHTAKGHKKDDEGSFISWDSDDPSFHREVELKSGLGPKLKIVIDKTLVVPVEGATKTTIKVNDVEARVIDIPASNGAWHVLDKVLRPPHKEHHPHDDLEHPDGEWAGWESWLPAWAAEYELNELDDGEW